MTHEPITISCNSEALQSLAELVYVLGDLISDASFLSDATQHANDLQLSLDSFHNIRSPVHTTCPFELVVRPARATCPENRGSR